MSASPTRLMPHVGLAQLGNSCFLNSIVQSLYLTDDFRAQLTSLQLSPAEMKKLGPLRALQHLLGMLMYCVRPSYSPKAFRTEMPERFRNGTQQDADEFAKYLLETVHSAWKELQASRMAGSAKRKAEEEGEGQPEQKVPAVTSAHSSFFDETAMVDVVERPSSSPPLHGQIRGGAEPSTVAVQATVLSIIPKLEHPRPAAVLSMQPQTSAPARPSPRSSSSVPAGLASLASPAARSSASSASPSPSAGSPPQHDIDPHFGGLISSCITCLRCGHESVKEEAFLELPLPMQQMDEERREQLHERIRRAREEAAMERISELEHLQPEQSASTASAGKDALPDLNKVDAQGAHLLMSAGGHTDSSKASQRAGDVRALPSDVLSMIARFMQSPDAAVMKRGHGTNAQPLSTSSSSPSSPAVVRPRSSPASPPASTTSAASSKPALPDAVLAKIAAFAAPGGSASPRKSAATAMKRSSAAPSTSAATSLPSSSYSCCAPSADSPATLLAALLAQTVLQATMQATMLTTVTTLTTAAALAQQLQQEKKKDDEPQQMEVEHEAQPAKEDKSTALVLYQPPPGSGDASAVAASPALAPPTAHSSRALLSLSSMLDLYLSPELLIGENAYHCSHCASKQSATLSCTISCPPPHLLIALKRNEYDAKLQYRTKIMTEVHFPAFLHLPSAAAAAQYALYSVVVHSGLSADSGHYYTIGRRSGDVRRLMRAEIRRRKASKEEEDERDLEQLARGGPHEFFLFNDESISAVTFTTIKQVTRKNAQDVAYLLFYVRLDEDARAGGEDSSSAPPVNPLLQRLAELEQQTFMRQQQKELREAAKKASESLIASTSSSYTPPAEGWTDPDMA